MKKLMFFWFLLLLLQSMSAIDHNWDDSFFSSGFNLQHSNFSGVEVTFGTSEFSLSPIEINGVLTNEIEMKGQFLPNAESFPNLPNFSRMIAVPEGAEVKMNFSCEQEEIFRNVDIAPAPRIPLETEDGLEYSWGKAYETDAFYPAELCRISEVDEMRGVDYVLLAISPFRYNPVKRELILYRSIKVELSFEGGSGRFGEDRLRSRWWDPILRSNLLNWESLPEIDYSRRESNNRFPDYEYIIISPTGTDFTTWADSIRCFRQRQGIRTGVVTLAETGSSSSQIENYINDAYYNWDIPPVAVLMLGDYGSNTSNTITSPTYNNYCVSDNILADISGNQLPDISLARITARNSSELELMIGKFLDYERNPPEDMSFYQNPVVAGGWQTERWFILCTEVVRGFWANELDKAPVRAYAIYQGTPGTSWSTASNTSTVVNYFGTNGLGYLPSSPSVIPSWNANATTINNAINSGCFMLQHRDHGGETGWGEPDYGNSNLSGLDNENLSFVFSTNCLTGKYNWNNECFAEAFHRHAQGALGLIAASEISYSFVNDTYVWGTYDYMWPQFDPEHGGGGDVNVLPCFANSSGKWYLQASNWPYNGGDKEVTYHLFHHHGDAFSVVYTEMPQELDINYPEVTVSGNPSLEITAEAGTFIALTVNDEIIATAEATGSPQTLDIGIQEPLTEIYLTATLQDHYREEATILVIPPEGAYAVVNSVDISTADDDIIEYNETVTLTAHLENFGNEMAENLSITITCDDEYITLIDNSETAPFIGAEATLELENAFSFSVAEDIPDNHTFYLTANVSSDQGNWESNLSLTGYAPVMSFNSFNIDGDNNNNGRLDPGEVANLNVSIDNLGGAELYNVECIIEETDEYLTITQNPPVIPEIAANSTGIYTWRVEVSQDAPVGYVISMDFTCEADYDFSLGLNLSLTVGLCLEDFESGGFSSYEWQMTGTGGWQISTDSYEGTYSAQSADIGNSQSAGMELEVNVLSPDDISFYYQVSSESNYDFLKFYIDGNLIEQWSGSISWTEYSYPVTSGIHTLKWEYDKDYTVSSGSDCAWIDYIIFPPISIPQPAEMILDNEEFIFNLLPQSSDSAELNITNVGGRDLEWTISKNYEISRESGGPDNYGYQWLDSDEPGGPVYNWLDISGSGTQIDFTHNDEAAASIPLSFTFNFYGTNYNSFIVNPNGWIGFGSDNTEWSNSALPDNDAPHPAIMGYWDDLYPEIGSNGEGSVYYQDFGTYLVVMFDDVQHYPGNYNGNYTFEMIIYDNGEMKLQYQSLSGDTDSATIGIQDENADDALQISYDENYAVAGLAIRIVKVVDWLDISSTSGSTGIGETSTITLSVDSEELEIGEFICNMVLNCNDPLQTQTVIPVNLFVGGDITYGDVDDNGTVEAFDAAIVLQYVVGIDPPGVPLPWPALTQMRADVDGNDSIEAFDASLIQQYSVGLINSFPVEEGARETDYKPKIIEKSISD